MSTKTKSKQKKNEPVVDFNLKIEWSAKDWKYVFNQLTLLDEANIIASEKGLELRAMDLSKVAMVDLIIRSEQFPEYSIKKGEVFRIGIRIAEIKEVLGRAKSDDWVELKLSTTNELYLTFQGTTPRCFKINLLDLGDSTYPAPDIETKSTIKLIASTIKDAIKSANIVSDHLKFHIKNKELIWSTVGDTKSFSEVISSDCDVVAEFLASEEITANYNLSYLDIMTKNFKASELISLNISNSMPIIIKTPIPGGFIRYFLAPRMEA